jgi:hypothetical protein
MYVCLNFMINLDFFQIFFSAQAPNLQNIILWCRRRTFFVCKHLADCQQIYHVGYTSSHSNTEVKQHLAWILLGWETLQGIPEAGFLNNGFFVTFHFPS